MAEAAQSTGAFFPRSVIARLLNISERRLNQLVIEGVIPKAGRNQYPLAGCIRGYVTFLQSDNLGGNSNDPDNMNPFNRRAFYQSELDKIKLQSERRELIPRLEVEQEMAALLKMVAEYFDTLSDVLERDCGLDPSVLSKVEERLDRTRNELHVRFTEDADARGTAGERA